MFTFRYWKLLLWTIRSLPVYLSKHKCNKWAVRGHQTTRHVLVTATLPPFPWKAYKFLEDLLMEKMEMKMAEEENRSRSNGWKSRYKTNSHEKRRNSDLCRTGEKTWSTLLCGLLTLLNFFPQKISEYFLFSLQFTVLHFPSKFNSAPTNSN